WLSFLPIALPVALITGKTVLTSVSKGFGSRDVPDWLETATDCFAYAGDASVAMTLAAAIALATVAIYRRADRETIARFVQMALSSAGMIILITSAGGAFGGILQQTGIGRRIHELSTHYQIAVLPLAFSVTALIRIAQGSATVAMITTVGILGSVAASGQMGFHPLYLALAIGCGSKPIPWMNDSGFWVICKMSGMTEVETLKTASTMMSLMGVVGLFVVMIAAYFLPLA
ncbi:GntP family permease, partial [Candidatus Sumerlaeota bacterium]|nr:GntP family permease [Candidatus Sumerlaeota bacterium]